MPINRVKPAKDSIEGYETEFDPNSDAIDVRGVYIQNDSSSDTNVFVSRDSSSRMTFADSENTSPVTLTQLLTGGAGIDFLLTVAGTVVYRGSGDILLATVPTY